MTNWPEKLTAAGVVLALLSGLGGLWLTSNNAQVETASRLYNVEQRLDKTERQMDTIPESITELKTDMRQMKQYAAQNLEVQKSLAASVSELAVQVGKLQERTK